MNISNTALITDLIERTKQVSVEVEKLQSMRERDLNYKPSEFSWSMLECIEHLNRYFDFYVPEIRQQIQNKEKSKNRKFKSGLLGNYFAKSMLPKAELNKMKTFKSMNPSGSQISKSVIDTFLNYQVQLLDLLEQSIDLDLKKISTGITISKFIRLRLGDTFRVVIYHNQRHTVQIKNIQEDLNRQV